MPARTVLLLLVLCAGFASSAMAWSDEGVPPDYEGPPWGDDRFQVLSIRAALEYALPVWGESGDEAAAYAPSYAEGWSGGMAGMGEIDFYFCPGYSAFLTGERFAFPAGSGKVVGVTEYRFGDLTGTAVAIGFGIQMPLMLETELWGCTRAPGAKGPVLYGKIGVGAVWLEALSHEATPPTLPGDPVWWTDGVAPYGTARLGIELRLLRNVGLFIEAHAGLFLPAGADEWPGAEAATALAFAGGRIGLSLLLV